MADNIVGNLFGVDMQSLQNALDAKAQAENLKVSQLDPYQAQRYYMSEAGRGIGKGINSLFGLEDPAITKQKQENEILQGVQQSLSPEDARDPYKLASAVFDAAKQAGNTDLANHAYQQMQAAQNQALAQGVKVAEISKNMGQAAEAQAKANQSFQEKLPMIERLIAAKGRATTDEARDTIQKQIEKEGEKVKASIEQRMVELADKKAQGTITQQEIVELDYLDNFKTKVAREGAAKSVTSLIEKDASSQIGDVLKANRPKALGAIASMNSVNDVRKVLNSPDLNVGPGATVKQWIGQFAQTYLGAQNEAALSKTRTAIQGLSKMALAARSSILQGQGAISDYENAAVEKATTGKIDELTKAEIGYLMDVIERDARNTHADYSSQVDVLDNPKLKKFWGVAPLPAPVSGAIKKVHIIKGQKLEDYSLEDQAALKAEHAELK